MLDFLDIFSVFMSHDTIHSIRPELKDLNFHLQLPLDVSKHKKANAQCITTL